MAEEEIPTVEASEKDVNWILDPKGYFLIRVDRDKKQIEVAYCENQPIHEQGKFTKNLPKLKVVGKHPEHIRYVLTQKGLLTRTDHAMCIGEELEKAYIALQKGIKYVQDDELKFDVPLDKDERRGT